MVLEASYGRNVKSGWDSSDFNPYFGTDVGIWYSLIWAGIYRRDLS